MRLSSSQVEFNSKSNSSNNWNNDQHDFKWKKWLTLYDDDDDDDDDDNDDEWGQASKADSPKHRPPQAYKQSRKTNQLQDRLS